MMKIFKVLSVSTVKSGGSQILKLAGDGSLSLLATGKKPQQRLKNMLKVKDILWLAKRKQLLLLHCVKMKEYAEHAESEGHIMACQTETAAASALREGSVLQQMHRLEECEEAEE